MMKPSKRKNHSEEYLKLVKTIVTCSNVNDYIREAINLTLIAEPSYAPLDIDKETGEIKLWRQEICVSSNHAVLPVHIYGELRTKNDEVKLRLSKMLYEHYAASIKIEADLWSLVQFSQEIDDELTPVGFVLIKNTKRIKY